MASAHSSRVRSAALILTALTVGCVARGGPAGRSTVSLEDCRGGAVVDEMSVARAFFGAESEAFDAQTTAACIPITHDSVTRLVFRAPADRAAWRVRLFRDDGSELIDSLPTRRNVGDAHELAVIGSKESVRAFVEVSGLRATDVWSVESRPVALIATSPAIAREEDDGVMRPLTSTDMLTDERSETLLVMDGRYAVALEREAPIAHVHIATNGDCPSVRIRDRHYPASVTATDAGASCDYFIADEAMEFEQRVDIDFRTSTRVSALEVTAIDARSLSEISTTIRPLSRR